MADFWNGHGGCSAMPDDIDEEMVAAKRAMKYDTGRPNRNIAITASEVTDLTIKLHDINTIDELINQL